MNVSSQKKEVYCINKINSKEAKGKFPEDALWESARELQNFNQPWGKADCPQISFKALHDPHFLYLRYRVRDSEVLIFEGVGGKMDVTQSDRVEIFISVDKQLQTYYCLEIDPTGRILDYSASYHRNFDYAWNWPKEGLFVDTDLQADGYQVDVKISKRSLVQLGLVSDHQMIAGLYLGHCVALPKGNNREAELNWLTWIDPNLENPDFHVPTSFGILQFSE